MATYLKYGSSGDEVKKLQQSLIDAGYNVGSGGADGQYGYYTQKAVSQYQADNGLQRDGIAGEQTLSKLYTPPSIQATEAQESAQGGTQAPTTSAQGTSSGSGSTPATGTPTSTDDAYYKAIAALQNATSEMPTYAGTYDKQLNDIYEQIINRDKFKYDINADALYQQYKDQYINLGQLAMKDTMGQAAALTGGYGSSYGQSVGQQQYDAYLQGLNEVVPELYGAALDRYIQEGDELYNLYATTGAMADDEYAKYQDAMSRYWQNVDFLNAERTNSYNRLMDMMETSGYNPTEQELAAAGMTKEQADSYLAAWRAANPDLAYRTGAITPEEYYSLTGLYPAGYAVPGSGRGSGGGGSYSADIATEQQRLKDLGLYTGEIDGIDGPLTQAARNAEGSLGTADTSDWDASDYEAYFAIIRQSEGSSAANKELQLMKKEGNIPSSMLTYAIMGANGKLGH